MCYSAIVDVMEERSAILSRGQPRCDALSWLNGEILELHVERKGPKKSYFLRHRLPVRGLCLTFVVEKGKFENTVQPLFETFRFDVFFLETNRTKSHVQDTFQL